MNTYGVDLKAGKCPLINPDEDEPHDAAYGVILGTVVFVCDQHGFVWMEPEREEPARTPPIPE